MPHQKQINDTRAGKHLKTTHKDSKPPEINDVPGKVYKE